MPSDFAFSIDITRHAEAPSESCDELPAVTEPWPLFVSNTGGSFSRPSSLVSGRLHSSLSTYHSSVLPIFLVSGSMMPRVTCMGAISSLKNPSSRSEEHTSELQSPYVISYAVFCLKKK